MKLQKKEEQGVIRVTFVPETEEEKLIMGSLRNHYFFGLPENGTYPKYAGISSEDNYVTAMHFTFEKFPPFKN